MRSESGINLIENRSKSRICLRNILWLGFLLSILAAWWWLYAMSVSMNMDLLGRSSMQMESMSGMSQMSSSSGMSEMTSANMSDMSDRRWCIYVRCLHVNEQADSASNMPSMETSSANDMTEDMEMPGEMSKGMDMQMAWAWTCRWTWICR